MIEGKSLPFIAVDAVRQCKGASAREAANSIDATGASPPDTVAKHVTRSIGARATSKNVPISWRCDKRASDWSGTKRRLMHGCCARPCKGRLYLFTTSVGAHDVICGPKNRLMKRTLQSFVSKVWTLVK